jgi:hypothetical protein|tara:strand:+ start:123 stop:755 length:633 start_codon:yes stop_codon:yes gene_type:complete
MDKDTVNLLIKQVETLYKDVKLTNLFKKYPTQVKGLRYGYICPGAMKTIAFLNTKIVNGNKQTTLVNYIKKLTDFQFFIEIYVIYKDYLDESLKRKITKILKNNSCKISNFITTEITRLFGELPPKIKENLPDDFYHIRHNTLICSKNKKLANERIELLKSIYGSVASFNNKNQFTKCLGKQDGISGCRDCCNHFFSNNTNGCVKGCMNF